jgi:hypothetical protein
VTLEHVPLVVELTSCAAYYKWLIDSGDRVLKTCSCGG